MKAPLIVRNAVNNIINVLKLLLYLQRREVSALHQAFHPSPESKPCLSHFFMLSVSLLLTRQKTKWSVTFNNNAVLLVVVSNRVVKSSRLPAKIGIYFMILVGHSAGLFFWFFRRRWQNQPCTLTIKPLTSQIHNNLGFTPQKDFVQNIKDNLVVYVIQSVF